MPDDVLALVRRVSSRAPRESRVALTLRVVAGLRAEEIARVPGAVGNDRATDLAGQRTLAEARVPFEVPQEDELAQRLSAVLEVVYLVFNEGYSASTGDAWVRRDVARRGDAARSGARRTDADQPEVHGLLALMELQASRFAARTDASGAPVLLPDQDRSRWDRTLIRHGFGSGDRVAPPPGSVHRPGRDRRMSFARTEFRRDRLGGRGIAVRRARAAGVAGGRVEPGGRGSARRRTGGRARRARCGARGPPTGALSPARSTPVPRTGHIEAVSPASANGCATDL